jgi:hypothetical protein
VRRAYRDPPHRAPPDALYFDAGSQMGVAAAQASEEFIKKLVIPRPT